MKHTTGPWECMEGTIVGPNIGSSEEKWLRPIVVKLASAWSLANRNVILAAPEMLEALQACAAHMVWTNPEGEAALIKARAAITKATGETE